jgi:DNA-binding CsgD family transcriptional regulator
MHTTQKPRRHDAGHPRVSPRDLELLRLIGEHYALTLPQLARLIGRSEHAARWLRARWQKAGWVEGRALLVGQPVFVWLTREGQRLAGLSYKLWSPNPGILAHVRAVVEVRLYVIERRPAAVWVSERQIARDRRFEPGESGHLPDALVQIDGREAAVEVELTLKKRARLERIVATNLARYENVWYFTVPATRPALEQIAATVGGGKLAVLPMPGDGAGA